MNPVVTSSPTSNLRSRFEQQGYLHLGRLFDDHAVAAWRGECERIWGDPELSGESNFRVDPRADLDGGRRRERLDPVTDVSPMFLELARQGVLPDLAGSLLGEPPVLFKDKLIYKEPGTLGYQLHQDFAYISHLGFPGSAQLVLVVAVDAMGPENGAIEVLPGFHAGLLPGRADDPALVDPGCVDEAEFIRVDLQPGEVLAMGSLCPHRSGPNRSAAPRRVLYFTYNCARYGDLYQTYYALGKP